jgi:hypothetical protein
MTIILLITDKPNSKLCYDRRSVDQSVLVSSTQSGAQDRICITLRQLRVCSCRAPSLTRGQICRLQLLLVLASSVILGSESRRTHDRFQTTPTWRARSPYLYPPGTWWPSYTRRYWVPFSSPPTTRRAAGEVFDPASTRGIRTEFLLISI